ncbi:hypothetical protein DAPPUDRAFT_271320 [Daphnia pulex]|uniref:Uncharacterized protein n=1 Tax=Daphnia pulex TaxID=6669 RepID=E9I1Z7_DAPPU|nr:hypothetical protein DAPPUDRAFT_271320 [Daphnia pulex]|eukprot:EFX61984.1 hypothetical protein DAPPUDRAFT_271320 [Daphnia pulex]
MGTEEAKFNLQKKLEEFIDIAEKQEMFGAATNIAAGSKGLQLIDAIRAVEVKFGSKLSAACHIAKHPTDPISDYLVFANKVIRDQKGDNPSISQKGDANIVVFSNPTGRAIVREKNNEVLLMTYYPFHY